MSKQKDFVKVDENGFVTKAQKTCFVLSFEDFEHRLNKKIKADEWQELCDSFEYSLQEESGWHEILEEALISADLAKFEEEDEDEEDEEEDEDE